MSMMRFAAIAFAMLLAACGGRDTTASKSAAAYKEAMAKGTPVTSGEGHHHGEAATEPADHSVMDHSTMDHSTMDHSTMDHSTMDHSTMDHSAMDHSTMDHSKMNHAAMDHASMDHSTMDHAKTDHSSMDHSTMDHSSMQHTTADHSAHTGHVASPPPPPTVPNTSANPQATLKPDPFDAPAPQSVEEAQKATPKPPGS